MTKSLIAFARYFWITIFSLSFAITAFAQQQTQQSQGQVSTIQQPQGQSSATTPQQKKKSPEDIKYTFQLSRAEKDLNWSKRYLESYKKSKEVSYLNLAATFCLKSINRLNNTRNLLSRTTRFYQEANQKRLQACQFYDKLQRHSYLLNPVDHLSDAGIGCR